MSGDRVVMITGAAGHLGRAVAASFAAAGDRLVLVDRSPDRLRETAAAHGALLLAPVDLLDADGLRAAVDDAVARLGRLDVLCHLAGGFAMGEPAHDTPDATWNRMQDLNVRTLRNAARAVVPHLVRAGAGKIVTVGAYAALRGGAGTGAYVAAKAEVIRLTESMSAELREHGINVNCVLPTTLDTPENRASMPQADPSRWVPLEALADAIRFLASDAARAVHGVALPVTGLG
jgi:NAD(P)-dependent dehydrogenase (short-subunit alcohol dehydrogenase family)